MTLRFADVSSHNTILNWGTFLGSLDGLVVKVSEGIGYTWSGAANALAQARSAGKLVGAYAFARVNDPVAEADYFLANYAHQPGEVIVLDWEPGTTVGDGDAWAYAWCSRVIAATGVVPWLYLNHYYAAQQSQWPRTRSLGCGLWAAWYGANTGQPLPGMPSFAPWPTPAAWQYTSNGTAPGHVGALDLNLFYGDAAAWRAYGTASSGGLTLASLTDAQAQQLLADVANIKGFLYAGGDSTPVPIGTDGMPILAQGVDGTSLFGRIANIQQALTAALPRMTPEQIAAAIGQLPATDAAQVASLVLAGLNGAQLNVTQPTPSA